MRLGTIKAKGARPPQPAARSRLPRFVGLAAALLLALAWAASSPAAEPRLVLNLVETDTGRVALSLPIEPGEEFTVWFLHSYDRAFFAEHYRALGPGRILLTHMTFKSNLNGEGFEYHDFHLRPDGVGELRNINEPRQEVHFMMGSPDMADHTLILRGKRIRLVNYVAPRTLVSFFVCQAPLKNKD
ncbi:DUF1850 domain-containing protein [Desulfoferula mesophila]|uniref:DUF1850 domain-containing protein n=1 Tax=Desulfoferula mesophila TaxID=3058419 RepID=A0AAU9ESH6_9BACT|nr:hypothetical protein FAK_31700 [Desulfoferula mesophilus]